MEEEEKDKNPQEHQPSFDWTVLGVEEFKGDETISQLKDYISKGKEYDSVAAYKGKYEDLSSFYDTVSDPTKYFADGEAGMRREQLRMKYPNITPDIAYMIAKDGEGLSPIEAMAVAHYLKSGGRSRFSDIVEVLKEEHGIEDGEEMDSKAKTRLDMKSAEAYEYIKSINADVKIPDIQKFSDYSDKRKQELEGLSSQLSTAWNEVVPEIKSVVKSTPITYAGEYELEGTKHAYSVPVELTDDDLSVIDVMVGDMSKSKTAPTKEVMSAIHEMVINASIKNKLPQIVQETARQIADSVKNKYTNPQLPRATDKPEGAEQVGTSAEDAQKVMAFMQKVGL